MYRSVMSIKIKQGAAPEKVKQFEQAMRDAPKRIPQCLASWVGHNVAAVDWTLVWDTAFEDKAANAAFLAHPDHRDIIAYAQPGPSNVVEKLSEVGFTPYAGETPEPGIKDYLKRSLVLAVRPGAPPAKVREFEERLAQMPTYIKGIRNWAMSRNVDGRDHPVDPSQAPWTHLWEQEFHDKQGIREYMESPFHWGVVDMLFDRDGPYNVVSRWIHVYYPTPSTILAFKPAAKAARR
ncbi:MAG: Dabb family protein [Chloroflexi bacterium]|nr:Dabb family protein [Chloroflexota bacterium]